MVSTQPLSWFRQEPTLAAGGEVRQNPCIPALPSPGPQFACLDNGQGLYTQQGLPLSEQAVVGGWAAHTGRISAAPKFIRRGFSLPPRLIAPPAPWVKPPLFSDRRAVHLRDWKESLSSGAWPTLFQILATGSP